MTRPSVSMLLNNYGSPFIEKSLAVRIARVIVEFKYPADIFVIDGEPLVDDDGDCWRVLFRNRLKTGVDVVYASELVRIRIKKSNGEIVDIS